MKKKVYIMENIIFTIIVCYYTNSMGSIFKKDNTVFHSLLYYNKIFLLLFSITKALILLDVSTDCMPNYMDLIPKYTSNIMKISLLNLLYCIHFMNYFNV